MVTDGLKSSIFNMKYKTYLSTLQNLASLTVDRFYIALERALKENSFKS